jgi:glutamate synthase (ferredoxin)
VQETGSKKGQEILDRFEAYVPLFKKIIPVDYKEMMKNIVKFEDQGADAETAKIEAFKAFVGGR